MLQKVNSGLQMLPLLANLLRGAGLLGVAAAGAAAFAWWLGDGQGWLVPLAAALAAGGALYGYGGRLVLRLYRAQPVDPRQAPHLWAMVRELAGLADVAPPRLFVVEASAANAFVVGRVSRRAALVVTSGILRLLDEAELRAVLAHELAHVLRGDMLPATLAAALGGLLAVVSRAGMAVDDQAAADRPGWQSPLWLLLGPLAAGFARIAGSAGRELAADQVGARLCGDAPALASALQRIQADDAQLRSFGLVGRYPAGAQMMVCDPLGPGGWPQRLFRVHPPLALRLRALREAGAPVSAAAQRQALERGVDQQAGGAVEQRAEQRGAEAADFESGTER